MSKPQYWLKLCPTTAKAARYRHVLRPIRVPSGVLQPPSPTTAATRYRMVTQGGITSRYAFIRAVAITNSNPPQ